MVLSIATFFGAAGSWARMVAPGFATMQADVQAAEGALLSHRARLHAYAEEVTMLQGAPAERQLMDRAASVHTRASRTCTCESGTAWAVKVVSGMSGARATPDLHASAHALA